MIDWVSFGLSLTAIIISSATALVGLIITWINHRKSFDPILAIDRERNLKTNDFEVCVKNIGRGTAYFVGLTLRKTPDPTPSCNAFAHMEAK